MSISIKLISKKLSFLSPVQPVVFFRKHVILPHRRCLTSQTQTSYLEKFPADHLTCSSRELVEDNDPGKQTKCICFSQFVKASSSDSTQCMLPNASFKQSNLTCSSTTPNTEVLDHALRLSAQPCLITWDDFALRNDYLMYSVNSEGELSSRLKYSSSKPDDVKSNGQNVSGRPTDEQLLRVREVLARSLPTMFAVPLDYSIYDKNIVYINNIRGVKTEGLTAYYRQISYMRMMGHVKFAYVKLEILKITSHPEDSTIRVRWRVRGIRGYMVIWNLFKHRVWKPADMISNYQDTWLDGFSTYYVGANGLVYKHIADKMMPDDNPVVSKANKTTPLAPKLAALCVGLAVSATDSIFSPVKSQNL